MALAVVAAGTTRSNQPVTEATIPFTITLSSTAYATASGGFAFDLAAVLNNAGPYDSHINPLDILQVTGFSTNGFMLQNFVLGTPTYNTSSDTSFNANLSLATCPCTAKLWGTGSANHAGFSEVSDGNLTDTISGQIRVGRSGQR